VRPGRTHDNCIESSGRWHGAGARQYHDDAVATLNRVIGNSPWNRVAHLTEVSTRESYEIAR
jgi:hypothetical protein